MGKAEQGIHSTAEIVTCGGRDNKNLLAGEINVGETESSILQQQTERAEEREASGQARVINLRCIILTVPAKPRCARGDASAPVCTSLTEHLSVLQWKSEISVR